MIRSSFNTDDTIALLREAHPFPEADPDAPDVEAELRVLMATLPARHEPRRGRSRNARRYGAVRIGAVAVGAAAATVIVLNVAGGGPDGGSGFVSEARAAAILHQAKVAASAYPQDEVLEIAYREHDTAPGESIWGSSTTWQSTTPPYDARFLTTGYGSASVDRGRSDTGEPQAYSAATNTIYEPAQAYDLSAGPRAGTRTLTVPSAVTSAPGVNVPAADQGTTQLTISDRQAEALRTGFAQVSYPGELVESGQVIGTEPTVVATNNRSPKTFVNWLNRLRPSGTRVKLDGRDTIEIISKSNGTYWLSAKTLTPIKSVSRTPVSGDTTGSQGFDTATVYYHSYRLLKGAPAQRLLSLQDAHPSAKVVVDPTRYYMTVDGR